MVETDRLAGQRTIDSFEHEWRHDPTGRFPQRSIHHGQWSDYVVNSAGDVRSDPEGGEIARAHHAEVARREPSSAVPDPAQGAPAQQRRSDSPAQFDSTADEAVVPPADQYDTAAGEDVTHLHGHGSTGQVTVDDEFVTIERKGFSARYHHGVSTGAMQIPLRSITAVEFREPTRSYGFIRFAVPGIVESLSGVDAARHDEHSVVFPKKRLADFEAIRDHVEAIVGPADVMPGPPPGHGTPVPAPLAVDGFPGTTDTPVPAAPTGDPTQPTGEPMQATSEPFDIPAPIVDLPFEAPGPLAEPAVGQPAATVEQMPNAPVPEAPVPEAPVPEAPVHQAPAAEAPATATPTTVAPAPPAPQAPAADTPTTAAPAPPAPQAPAADTPTTAAPVSDTTTTQVPTTEVPAGQVPTSQVPANQVPTTDVPQPTDPTTEALLSHAPTTDAPVPAAPTPDVPQAQAPTAEAPVQEAPVQEVPAPEGSVHDMPAADMQGPDVPAPDVEPRREAPTAAPGETTGTPGVHPAGEPGPELVAQLRELAGLRDDGILTAEEFEAQKARLLGS